MITKRVLKKTITGAAVALMACVSTGAMAEKRWVRTGDYFTDFGGGYGQLWGDANICNVLVEDEKLRLKPYNQDMYWTGDIELYISSAYSPGKICIVANNYRNLKFYPMCKQGSWHPDRPDDCYVWKEPLVYPENPPKNPIWGPARGAVACDEAERKVCTYITENFWTDDGEDIAKRCLVVHESSHKMTIKRPV